MHKSEETIGSQRLLEQTVVLVTIQVLRKLSVEDVSTKLNALNGVYRTKDSVSGVALQSLN